MNLKASRVFILLGVLAMVLSGCERDEERVTGYGTMNIRLSANSSVIEVGASSNTRSNTADSLSVQTTRAEEEVVPTPPDFALTLFKGELQVKQWDSYTDFDDKEKIAVGEYVLTASYGEAKKEGFEAPYYEGSSEVRILEGENTDVDITCYLANVQLTVKCSEAVQKYFSSFTMQVRSSAGIPIDIAKNDIRPVYLQPGLLVLETQLRKQNATKDTKLELLRIPETSIRQHYIVNVDVNEGEVGSSMLNVTYHTVKSEEKVEIDLSDAALNIKEPVFTAQGFDNGQSITLREGSQPEAMKVTLNARGGIRSCDLLINSPYLNSESVGIAGMVELVPTSEEGIAMKQRVLEKGLRLLGLDDNIERLALIDFTQLVMNMLCTGDADETSKFTLRAVDKGGRVQETELSFTMVLQSNQFSFPPITKKTMIGSTEAEATINLLTSGTTGEQDVNNVVFEYKDESGGWVPAGTEWINDDANEQKVHAVKIKNLPEVHRNLTIRARYGSKTSVEQTLEYYIPDFRITADPADIWARKATMKVEADTPAERDAVLKYLKFTYNGSDITTTNSENSFLWTGLNPGTTYELTAICNEGGEVTKDVSYDLVTEMPMQLPNSDFEGDWIAGYYDGQSINMGGPWSKKDGALATWGKETYQQSSWNNVKIPVGWETVNAKTMPTNPTVVNTWYVVPSTERAIGITNKGSYCMKIVNVGWNDNGSKIALYGTTAWFGVYYDTFPGFDKMNIPQSLNYSAGRLFLGTYSYNSGSENYSEGYSFTSRPSKMTFWYRYISKIDKSKDKGYVRVALKNGNEIIFEKDIELEDTSDNANAVQGTIKFLYPANSKKPTSISVMFCSSIVGKNMDQSYENANISHSDIGTAAYKAQACVTGSELYIDDIELIY